MLIKILKNIDNCNYKDYNLHKINKGGVIILEKLKNSLKGYFDIYDNYSINNYNFDFMGEYILTNSRYFLSKDKIIDSYENKEYIFAKSMDNLSKTNLTDNILPFAEYAMNNMIQTNEKHMSTVITLFFSSNDIDPQLYKFVKKYKNRRSYKLGLRGYASTRLILFNSQTKEIIYNKESKDVIKFYKEVLK